LRSFSGRTVPVRGAGAPFSARFRVFVTGLRTAGLLRFGAVRPRFAPLLQPPSAAPVFCGRPLWGRSDLVAGVCDPGPASQTPATVGARSTLYCT